LQTGGLPELYKLKDQETKNHYIASLRDTIILKDVVQRHKIKNVYL
jgi:predicted AAA+ superfamily ATPase